MRGMISGVVAEIGDRNPCLAVVTGDLVDSPTRANWAKAGRFLKWLEAKTHSRLVLAYGNHDLRTRGILSARLRCILHARLDLSKRREFWDEARRFGVIAVNSAQGHHFLACGGLSPRQLERFRSHARRMLRSRDGVLLVALHHHPLPVAPTGTLERPRLRRFLGKFLEPLRELTLALVNADEFLELAADEGVGGILHGHKHIPFLGEIPGADTPVCGCGSTAGLCGTVDGRPYLSVNLIHYSPVTRELVLRLAFELAEPRTALREEQRHEYVAFPGRARGVLMGRRH